MRREKTLEYQMLFPKDVPEMVVCPFLLYTKSLLQERDNTARLFSVTEFLLLCIQSVPSLNYITSLVRLVLSFG